MALGPVALYISAGMPSLLNTLPEFVCFKALEAHPLKEVDPNHSVLTVGGPVLVLWDQLLTVYSAVY